MDYTKLAAGLLAALVLFAGAAAALPGNAPDDVPADGNESETNGDAGPPSDLPGPVPDFVRTLLDRITAFLNGELDGPLGPQLSDVTPGGAPTPSDG